MEFCWVHAEVHRRFVSSSTEEGGKERTKHCYTTDFHLEGWGEGGRGEDNIHYIHVCSTGVLAFMVVVSHHKSHKCYVRSN